MGIPDHFTCLLFHRYFISYSYQMGLLYVVFSLLETYFSPLSCLVGLIIGIVEIIYSPQDKLDGYFSPPKSPFPSFHLPHSSHNTPLIFPLHIILWPQCRLSFHNVFSLEFPHLFFNYSTHMHSPRLFKKLLCCTMLSCFS